MLSSLEKIFTSIFLPYLMFCRVFTLQVSKLNSVNALSSENKFPWSPSWLEWYPYARLLSICCPDIHLSRSDKTISRISCILPLIHSGIYPHGSASHSFTQEKKTELVWSEKEQSAFEYFKSALCRAPVLAFPNFDKEFTICTVASGFGIGAVFIKQDNSKHIVTTYASTLLNKPE